MPRQVVVHYMCDVHPGREADVTDVVVTFGAGTPKFLDLCNECNTALVEPLAAALAEHGHEVAEEPKKTKAKTPGKILRDNSTCPLCGHVASSRDALGAHLSSNHGTRFRQLRAEGVDV